MAAFSSAAVNERRVSLRVPRSAWAARADSAVPGAGADGSTDAEESSGTACSEPALLGQAVTATVVISAPAATAGPATRATRAAIGAGMARRGRTRT